MTEERKNKVLTRLTNAIEELQQASILMFEDYMNDICNLDDRSADSAYEGVLNMIQDIIEFIDDNELHDMPEEIEE